MDEILNFQRQEEDDFYFILGCNEDSTEGQINAEYKARVLGCHPDKHPDDASAHEQFSRLSEAKDVLLDAEKRKDYDKWRSSGIAIPFESWKAMRCVKTSMHWGQRKEQTSITAQQRQPSVHPTPMTNKSETTQVGSTSDSSLPSMNFVHRVKESSKVPGWESDNSNPLLQKFRNYEI